MIKMIFIYSLTLVILVTNSYPAKGEPEIYSTQTTDGTDIIILVDQSGSMSGRILRSKAHPEPNDEHGYRRDTIRLLITRLFSGSEQSHSRGKDLTFNLCVIEFGDTANVVVDWSNISFDPAVQYGSGLAEIGEITRRIDIKNMGDTHLLKAFEKAYSKMREINTGSPVNINRKLRFILITDGKPYSEDSRYFRNRVFNENVYLRSLTGQINSIKNFARQQRVQLTFNVLALNDASPSRPYWNTMGPYWSQIANTAELISDANQMHSYVDRICGELTNVPPIVIEEEFECPYYIRKLTISIYYKSSNINLSIKNPGGQALDLNRIKSIEEQTYRQYEINYPEPGLWRFEGTKDIDIRAELYFDKVELVEPVSYNTIPRIPFKSRWHVTTQKNNEEFIPVQGAPPVNGYSIIGNPQGTYDSLMTYYDGKGIFITDSSYTPPVPGRYSIEFRGIINRTHSPPIEIFSSEELEFNVSQGEPIVAVLEEPRNVSLLFGRTNFDVKVSFEDFFDTGNKLKPEDISSLPDSLLTLNIFDKNNNLIIPPIRLSVNKDNDNLLSADVSVNYGISLLDILKFKRNLIMKFDFNHDKLYDKYVISNIRKR